MSFGTPARKWLVAGCFALLGCGVSGDGEDVAGPPVEKFCDPRRGEEDPVGLARCLLELGRTRAGQGDVRRGLEDLRQARALFESSGEERGRVEAEWEIGAAHLALDEMDESRSSLLRALEGARGLQAPELGAPVLNLLAEYQFAVGDLEAALASSLEALELARSAGEERAEAFALTNLGAIYRNLGESGMAIRSTREALEMARRLGDVETELTLLNNLGVALRSRGELESALTVYHEALRRSAETGDRANQLIVLSNLGRLYAILGESERALELHRRSLELARALESLRYEAMARQEIGWLHESLGEPQKALEVFAPALETSRQIRATSIEGYLLLGMGRAHQALGAPDEALSLFRQALEVFVARGDLIGRMEAQRHVGVAQRDLGRLGQAEVALERSLELGRLVGDDVREAITLSELARLARAQGDLAVARERVEAALERIESLRAEVLSPNLRATFLARRHDNYSLYVELLLELERAHPGRGHAADAFAAWERGRARSLLELLTEAREGVRRGLATELRQRQAEINGRLTWLQRELVRELSREPVDEARVQELRRGLDEARLGLERFEGEVRSRHPRYAEVTYPSPLDLAGVQKLLGEEVALLGYALGDSRSHLFVIRRDRMSVHALAPQPEIAGVARELRDALRRPGRRGVGRLLSSAHRLHDLVLAPAREALEGAQTLLVAPDGELHYLPFEVLLTEPPATAGEPTPYLLRRFGLSYVPSGTVLESLRRRGREAPPPAGRRFVALADPALERAPATQPEEEGRARSVPAGPGPLPGARREVAEIAGLFEPGETRLYQGSAASERLVKRDREVARARWLHFACHAVVDERHPALSALLLMPDTEAGGEDGLLQSHELLELRLQAELVVLSACDTGLGRSLRGEGILGLTRAFMYAGVRSVMVSLWRVSDRSTAELMVRFYRHLGAGVEPVQAARLAKLELAAADATSHPYHWSPFVLFGAPRSGP